MTLPFIFELVGTVIIAFGLGFCLTSLALFIADWVKSLIRRYQQARKDKTEKDGK